MEAGSIVGARDGGPIVVYSPDAKELTGDAAKIATGTITFADAFRSEAEVVLADGKLADLPPLARAVLVSPGFSVAKRVVAVDQAAPGLLAALREGPFVAPVEESGLLAKLNLESVSAPITWEIAVVRATYAEFKVGRDRPRRRKTPNRPAGQQGFFIGGRGGIALYDLWVPATAPDVAERFRRALESHVKAENVRAMSNETSGLKDKIKVEAVRHKGIRQAAAAASSPRSLPKSKTKWPRRACHASRGPRPST
jgi:hypothetical protein